MHPALIIGGFLLLVGVLIGFSWMAQKKRREAMEGVARELGLEFSADEDPSVTAHLHHLRLFNQGHGRRFRNMISGVANGVSMAIFDYQFTTGGGKNQQTHRQTVISFKSEHLLIPDFEVRPENVFHKIGQAFGYGDIDFDSHPVFSKKFLLRGPDEPAIRELFTDEKLTFFENYLGICAEGGADQLLFYRARKIVKPDMINEFMTEGFSVYGQFKQE